MKTCRTVLLTAILLFSSFCLAENYGDLSKFFGFEELEIIKIDWGISNLNIADIDRDGKNDIAVVNNRESKIVLYFQRHKDFTNEKQAQYVSEDIDINELEPAGRFEEKVLPVSEKIYSMKICDLNSDDLLDVVYYGDPKGLYVLYQKKRKNAEWKAPVKFEINDGLTTRGALACGDFDNDNKNDVILASRQHFYLLKQKSGGTFNNPVKYPSAERILGIEYTDVDGDSVNDIIIVTNDNEKPVQISFGKQDGGLGPQIKFKTNRPSVMLPKNINNERGSEILMIDAVTGRLLGYNLKTAEDSYSDWPMEYYALPSGEENDKRDIIISDVTNNGREDIVISSPGTAEIILYENKEGSGLSDPKNFPSLTGIDDIEGVDIDNDDSDEVIILSQKEKTIGISDYKNNRLTFPSSIETIDSPLATEFGDINNDGKVDCLFIGIDPNNVRKLRIVKNLEKNIEVEPNALLVLDEMEANPESIKIVDADNDGLKDLIAFVKYEDPIFIKQVKEGKFEIPDKRDTRASLISKAFVNNISVDDVDMDCKAEILVAQDNFARSLVMNNEGKWQVVDQFNAKGKNDNINLARAYKINPDDDQKSILLFDNRRGNLHILKYEENEKKYNVEKTLKVGKWTTSQNLKLAYERINNENTKSLVLFDGSKFALITPPSEDFKPFELEQMFIYETKIKDGVYGNMTIGDINSDKVTDLIMVDYRKNHIEILTFDDNMEPVPGLRFKIYEEKNYNKSNRKGKASVEPRELMVKDVTGDGKNDLVTVIHDRVIIYPQD